MNHHRRRDCRVCGARKLYTFLELGPMPLANSFPNDPDQFAHESAYPLDVCFCEDCSLVQTPDVIDPEMLFRDYIYVTGTSETIAAHNRSYAADVSTQLELGRDDWVVEIASNDGSLLRCFQAHDVRTLGVEPASNIAERARAAGVETLNVFFNETTAAAIRANKGPARAVVANNVLAHVDDVLGFLRGCRTLLSDDGRIVIEIPYLGHLLDRLEYDTIYHEHLSYFSIATLLRAYAAVDLAVVRIDHVPVHGGSLRIHAERAESGGGHNPEVLAQADAERRQGLDDPRTYGAFADRVARHRTALVEKLSSLRDAGFALAGYGAPAKGNTLLNYCRIDTALLDFTVDRNALKVGRFTPGMHIPVLAVEALLERQPDYVLILAWNFAEEILRQQQTYRDRGGKFILPLPEPSIV